MGIVERHFSNVCVKEHLQQAISAMEREHQHTPSSPQVNKPIGVFLFNLCLYTLLRKTGCLLYIHSQGVRLAQNGKLHFPQSLHHTSPSQFDYGLFKYTVVIVLTVSRECYRIK